MKKYFNKTNLVQTIFLTGKLAFLGFLMFQVGNTFAQPSRIAIVNLADSNLIYKHVGFTGFKDKADTFDCQLNCKKYIDQELNRILSSRYTVSFISVPESVLSPNGSIYNSLNSNSETRSWITNAKDLYDFIIFVETGQQDDLMDTKKQKIRSCGLYSRGNPSKSWVAIFCTTSFTAIRPSNLEAVDYDFAAMDYVMPITDYQFSRQNLLIDTDMLPLIRTDLIKLIDYKLEYFLTNSFLMPNADFDKIKSEKKE